MKFSFVIAGIILSVTCCEALAYPAPVAVLENYDDVEENITIERFYGEPDGADELLYSGDKISGEVKSLQVKCGPYAEIKSNGNNSCIVSYAPPSGIWGAASSVSDKAASFWFNVESVASGASRGSDNELNLTPQPGFDVTLLSKQEVRFKWDEAEGNEFFIKDADGNIITERDINGFTYFDVALNSLGLKPKEIYTWGIKGSLSEYSFRILDEQAEKELSSKLEEIDGENISRDEKVLRKAAYVQMISDMYPDIIDLYWLSMQLLSEIDSAESQKEKSMLLQRCRTHLDNEM